MYRQLGTRGTVFGVSSGPYAGRERIVAFGRLAPASKSRLVEALAGRRQLSPILRATRTGIRFTIPGTLLAIVGFALLFARSWPGEQSLAFAAGYVALGLTLAGVSYARSHAIAYGGMTIGVGTYLFPLDVIEATRDGTLRLIPLGSVRAASVTRDGPRTALRLTFVDGTAREFPVRSEEEAERAHAALEFAQETLEKLTYGGNMADAINLDPFFEVRIDNSWESAAPRSTVYRGLRLVSTVGLGLAFGLGLFVARNALARNVRDAQRRRVEAEMAALQARIADQDRAKAEANARAPSSSDAALDPARREARDHAAGIGLDAYRSEAPSPDMAKLVADLVALRKQTGKGLDVYFARTLVPCNPGAACAPPNEALLSGMERRVASAFAEVFSQVIPRDALPIRLVSVRPDPPALVVEYKSVIVAPEAQAIEMTFDAKLTTNAATAPHSFRLTMPRPARPLTHARDRSLFTLGENPSDEELVYARGFDRLYDEIYGMFFSGLPVVPLPSEAAEETARTFGGR